MKTLIVFDHPYTADASENEPHNRSFCAALCKRVRESEQARDVEVDLIDLAKDGFNPVMSKEDLARWRKGVSMDAQISGYQGRMASADRIVFVFPIWWELMPAATKGFIDKVYAKNILYSQSKGGKGMKTLLKPNAEVVVVSVMGTPKALYRFIFKKPVAQAIGLGMCRKTGIRKFRWIPFSGVDRLTMQQRQRLIENFER